MTVRYPWDDEQGAETPQPEGAETTAPAEASGDQHGQQEPSATDELLKEVRAARNQMSYLQRRLDKQEREGLPLSRADREALATATSRIEATEERRLVAEMTDEERADYFEKKAREVAEQARTPQQPVTVDREAPEIVDQLRWYFEETVTAEIQEMAEDIGLTLTDRELRILRDHGVQNVPIGRDGTADWAAWVRKEARPALRAEARRQAAESAKGRTTNGNGAGQGGRQSLPAQGALGETSRGGQGAGQGLTWQQAQKAKSLAEFTDADYERLLAAKK